MFSQPGLRWVLNKRYMPEPTWTHDPDVETIVKLSREHLHFHDDDNCTADYFMQGAFNRVYLIRCPRGGEGERSFVFRTSLPVDPGFKVASDVATMNFVRNHTDAPVPRVLAFDPSHKNEIGFAWTIMEMMPGRPLIEQWRYMTWEQKESLVRRVAEIWSQIFRHKFGGIGNIYHSTDASPHRDRQRNTEERPPHAITTSTDISPPATGIDVSPVVDFSDENWHVTEFTVDRIVSMSFHWHNRVHYDVYRGPFVCSFDWLAARLTFVIMESDGIVCDPDQVQQQKTLAGQYSSTARRLRQQLPNFFTEIRAPPTEVSPEITMLHHYDTSGYNVLVDDDGMLTALLDWDSVSTVPLWKACQMPEFLVSSFIDEMGDDRQSYIDRNCAATQVLREQTVSREKAQLRALFVAEMEKLEPEWVEIYTSSVKLADFEVAVELCDSIFQLDLVNEWLDDLEQGREYWSLQRRLLGEE
jgi:aminoglycoside phosphotransferase (APT) family kinase protein